MQKTITADFDSVDRAELAVGKLRQFIGHIRVDVGGERIGSMPADAPLTASAYYPRQAEMGADGQNPGLYNMANRVIFTSDILGLPVYHDNPTTVRVTVDAADAMRTRALLLNAGGRSLRVQ